jgi:predicted Fe-Mo cluster-binding NifX family protein
MKKNVRIFYLIVSVSAFFTQALQGLVVDEKSTNGDTQSTNLIAVSAVGDSELSDISDKAARAPYFLIFDDSGLLIKAVKNPAQNQRGGASTHVAALLKKESVKILIAAKFGTKMQNNLKSAGIQYLKHSGIAKEVVGKIIKSKRSKNAKK